VLAEVPAVGGDVGDGERKGAGTLSEWEFVKTRTAASGAVWRSCEGLFYKRTGTADLMAEAECLQELAGLGYPVPEVVETGRDETGQYFFVERSVGEASLHDQALVEAEATGLVGPRVLDAAAAVSARLLTAQARTPPPGARRRRGTGSSGPVSPTTCSPRIRSWTPPGCEP
jgi:hypothetical protein